MVQAIPILSKTARLLSRFSGQDLMAHRGRAREMGCQSFRGFAPAGLWWFQDRRTGVFGEPGCPLGNLTCFSALRGWQVERRRNMDRTEKREFVTGLNQALAATSMIVVTRNSGLTVAEVTELRRKMGAAGATYKVAKNRLTNLALDGTQFGSLKPLLKGPIALAWSTDPVAVAKTAVEFAKTNEKFVVVGGALGAQSLNADGIKALAELPSLNELRARLVGMISTPATRIAGILQAPAGQLARVFGAYAKRDEVEAEAA
jgi:large subunit ribosomal protein L10